MLKITLDPGPKERFLQVLRAKGPRIAEALRGRLTGLMFMLGAYVVQKKLSGTELTG